MYLFNDIEFDGTEVWNPIGKTGSTTFLGSFDGQGNRIKNLVIDTTGDGRIDAAAAGLFGWLENANGELPTVISDLRIDRVTITSGKHAGAIAGYTSKFVTVQDCVVENAVITGTRVAAIIGFQNSDCVVTGCTVDNAVLTGSESVGEFAGYVNNPANITRCTATNTQLFVSSDKALEYAIKNAGTDTTIHLVDGNYNMPTSLNGSGSPTKSITFKGTEGVVISSEGTTAHNVTISFDGVTVKWIGHNEGYQGINHAAKVSYANCTIEGVQFMYADAEFTNCTFKRGANEGYSVWTYGAKNVTFTGCTFNTGGRAVLVYNEKTDIGFVANVTLTKCTFSDDGTYTEKSKAVVETGSNANNTETSNKYNLRFEECTVTTGFETNNSDSNLWGNKNSMDTDHLDVVIDGVDVF